MILENSYDLQKPWQTELARVVTRFDELLNLLELDIKQFPGYAEAAELFALRVPRPFIKKMRKGDPNDPLLLQVLPQRAEFQETPGYSHDPLAEQQQTQTIPGLLHKYQSRILLILRGGCAINCRYCFRRHFPYQDHHIGREQQTQIVDYIKQHPEVNEVILSGGDPLMAKDHHLDQLIKILANITHLTRIRVHSRLPVTIPDRITPELISALTSTKLKPIFVLHINHPNEIDNKLSNKVAELTRAGVMVLNQSVLLARINDQADILKQLSEKLFASHIMPYYIHLPDEVQGTAHFDVTTEDAMTLYRELQRGLPGFLVPKMVKEVAYKPHKVLISDLIG